MLTLVIVAGHTNKGADKKGTLFEIWDLTLQALCSRGTFLIDTILLLVVEP